MATHPPAADAPQLPPADAALDRQRFEWKTRWGSIFIEVRGNTVWVNGKLVEPASSQGASMAKKD